MPTSWPNSVQGPTNPSKINLTNYILAGPVCEKAWIYERVPGFELAGYDDRIENNILTRKECQELCLAEKSLPCRSAEYDYKKYECRLSQVNKVHIF